MTTTMLDASLLDQSRIGAFENRLIDMLNDGALAVMLSLGFRTGLLESMADLPPSTSAEIAEKTGLHERYVREWLGAMTVGRIVEHDPEHGTYMLPPEHAALLSDKGMANMGVFMQYIPIMGTIEDDIVACFRNGGGVPYSRFVRFHEVMAQDSGQTVIPALRDHILPLVPGLIDALEDGIRVLDLGCGRGRALNLMAQWFPKSTFVGYDLSEEATAYARAEAERLGNTNATFEARDLTDFDVTAEPGAYHFVTTFDAIHDQAAPLRVLRGIRRTLADNGVYLAQDIKGHSHHHQNIDHPAGPLLYAVSTTHCMTVSLAQGGEGLGTMWGREKALEYFERAGFTSVEVNELDHDFMNYYYVCRP